MPTPVEQQLVPVLKALAAAKEDFDPDYERAFEALLNAKGPAAAEARIALMDYYVGEHNAEELVCAVAEDGRKGLIRRYSRCDIRPTVSPVPRDRSLPLRMLALSMIASGSATRDCTFD
ncbi:MAG: hypothetical protein JSS86_00045 [Cyanobacteria bacterium SZAS LIN-2]|nr:hypothetical protein [Cyanobacteria bacterium SZAS LIN-2]